MSDPRPRYWIATHEPGFFTPKHVLSLPDAEHIHVTRHPDGTYTAVPMEHLKTWDSLTGGWQHCELGNGATAKAWVDCPTGPAEGRVINGVYVTADHALPGGPPPVDCPTGGDQ